MNYRYDPQSDDVLKAIVARNPGVPLHEMQRAHPALRSLSIDHLSLRLARLQPVPHPPR